VAGTWYWVEVQYSVFMGIYHETERLILFNKQRFIVGIWEGGGVELTVLPRWNQMEPGLGFVC
jgi:hypothetical protein